MSNICKRPPVSKPTAADKRRDEQFRAWLRTQRCCNCNALGEWVQEKGRAFCQAAHIRLDGKGGTAIKPLFSACPLCDACHRKQHRSHLDLQPREWWIEQRDTWLRRWLQLVR